MVDFGICDSPVIANMPDLQLECDAFTLTLQDIASASMALHPDVPFAWLQSKSDAVQEAYYDAIGLSMDDELDVIDDAQFFDGVNTVFADYAKNHDNAVTYMVDSHMHTYTGLDVVYRSDATGAEGGGDGISMLDWISQFPLAKNQTVVSVCHGDVVSEEDRPEHDTGYCAEEVESSYTQK